MIKSVKQSFEVKEDFRVKERVGENFKIEKGTFRVWLILQEIHGRW